MLARIRLSNGLKTISRLYSEGASNTAPPPSNINVNVPGLSAAVVHPATEPLGPGVDPNKTGAYKVPEYFCYNNMSYFEAEIEMARYRLPQPSAVKKERDGWSH